MRTQLPAPLRGKPFTLDDGRRAGLSERRMRDRDLHRPHRGVRVEARLPRGFSERCRAYAALPRPGQFFSHITAARIWGIPLPPWQPSEPLHAAVHAPARALRVHGVIGHQFEDHRVGIRSLHGLSVSDPVSTWLHLATALSHYDLVAAGDYLVRTPRHPEPGITRPLADVEALASRAARYTGRGRRNAVLALDRIRTGVDSPQETRLRLLMVDDGLPEPLTDVPIHDSAGGRITWVDLYYPGLRLVVEYDGQQHRTSDKQYARDVVRLGELHDAGEHVLRFDKFGLSGTAIPALIRIRSRMTSLGWPDTAAT